jgi:hypothetical protein
VVAVSAFQHHLPPEHLSPRGVMWEHSHKRRTALSAQNGGSKSPHRCNKLFLVSNRRRAAQRRPGIKGNISSKSRAAGASRESGTGSGLVRFPRSKFWSKFLKRALTYCCRLENSLLPRSNPVCCCFSSPSVGKRE